MPNTFFASDHHFGHQNILTFVHRDGTMLREFDNVDQMDQHMIERHNSVVGPKDTCWFLGDVVINRRFLHHIAQMNGRKRLVLGNHDIFKNKDYINAGFEDLHAFRKFDSFVATHIPVHKDSMRGKWGVNVHGHLHRDRVMMDDIVRTDEVNESNMFVYQLQTLIDPQYYCVCVEQLDDYTPIALEDLKKKIL